MVLLDSCVISHIQDHPEIMADILSKLTDQKFAIAFVSTIELYGSVSPTDKQYLNEKFVRYPVLLFDSEAQKVSERICRKLQIMKEQRGDMMIACVAIAHKVTLITENSKDFQAFLSFGLDLKTYNLKEALSKNAKQRMHNRATHIRKSSK